MHHIDGKIEFLEILLQRPMIMARSLHEYIHMLKRGKLTDAVDEGAESLTGILEGVCWACLKALMTQEQGSREETSNVFSLPNIHPNVDGLILEHGNRFENRPWLASFRHRSSLFRWKRESMVWVDRPEPVEVPLPSTAKRFLAGPIDILGVLNTSVMATLNVRSKTSRKKAAWRTTPVKWRRRRRPE